MHEFEKLYTVDDIAQMTMLTTRTIRNYLKDGLLTGRKVGGQWRFTNKDIECLFENSSVEEEMKNNRRQEVMDFINGINTDMNGEIQLCTIADYYCSDRLKAATLSERFQEVVSSHDQPSNIRYYYEYIEKEQKARYTFLGTPSYIKAAVTLLEEKWNQLNASLSKFNDKAKNYASFRPSYPPDAIHFIHQIIGNNRIRIADIGSGTGKMTKLLLDQKYTVYAVEPNTDMRKEAEAELGSHKDFHSIIGTAENTTLQANNMDAIVCSEAYHWFDNEKTILEFKRILNPDGYVFLFWNIPGDNNYQPEMNILYDRYCKPNTSEVIHISKEERAMHLFGEGNYQIAEFDNTITQPFEALLGGLLSASFAPKPEDSIYNEYVQEVKALFDQYSQNDLIVTKFKTVCYYGKIR